MQTLDSVIGTSGTGSDLSAGTHTSRSKVPIAIGIALVGTFTGASSCIQPAAILDWTSANAVELAVTRPFSLAEEFPAPTHRSHHLSSDVRQLKERTGLTWEQLADVFGVRPRALHLWGAGGGITAAHDERVAEFTKLVDTIYSSSPGAVRSELIGGVPGQSLLDQLRSGARPLDLAAIAPWRSRAQQEVTANVAAYSNDGIVDEDYLFLLYTDRAGADAFAEQAQALLGDPRTTRQSWESFVDAQFAAMEQPKHAAEVLETPLDEPSLGVVPLFDPFELGVALGPGAIAGRGSPAVE
jgi:hypothetical protein